jgi:hypothetical protein
MKELEKLIMALYIYIYIFAKVFTPGERAPGTHWIGGWVGPITGLNFVEKRNILPLPVARRDSKDTGVLRVECTPLHIYFSLEFCL